MRGWRPFIPSRLLEDCITPKQYLEFAYADVEMGELRGRVNGLGNIKRAIEAQLDIILEKYCLLHLAERSMWPFPKKIEIIQKIGDISPNILKQINTRRNKLEHYHQKPSKEEVQNFLDIAELFVELYVDRDEGLEHYYSTTDKFAFYFKNEMKELHFFEISSDQRIYTKDGVVDHDYDVFKEHHEVKVIEVADSEEWIQFCVDYLKPLYRRNLSTRF